MSNISNTPFQGGTSVLPKRKTRLSASLAVIVPYEKIYDICPESILKTNGAGSRYPDHNICSVRWKEEASDSRRRLPRYLWGRNHWVWWYGDSTQYCLKDYERMGSYLHKNCVFALVSSIRFPSRSGRINLFTKTMVPIKFPWGDFVFHSSNPFFQV